MPPFIFTTPVRFADVDHAGIVYYPRFFHFFHLAFEELFRERMGARAYVTLLDERRVGFPAVRAEADYKSPLRFGDTAEIEVSIPRLGGKSITFRYRIYRAATPQAPRVLSAEGTVVCAVVDLARVTAQCNACKTARTTLESQVTGLRNRQKALSTPLETEQKAIQAAIEALNGAQPDAALQARIKAWDTKRQQAAQEISRQEQQIQRNTAYVQKQIADKLAADLASM